MSQNSKIFFDKSIWSFINQYYDFDAWAPNLNPIVCVDASPECHTLMPQAERSGRHALALAPVLSHNTSASRAHLSAFAIRPALHSGSASGPFHWRKEKRRVGPTLRVRFEFSFYAAFGQVVDIKLWLRFATATVIEPIVSFAEVLGIEDTLCFIKVWRSLIESSVCIKTLRSIS